MFTAMLLFPLFCVVCVLFKRGSGRCSLFRRLCCSMFDVRLHDHQNHLPQEQHKDITSLHLHMHARTHTRVYINEWLHTCLYTAMCLCVHECVHTCMNVRAHDCMHVCMNVCPGGSWVPTEIGRGAAGRWPAPRSRMWCALDAWRSPLGARQCAAAAPVQTLDCMPPGPAPEARRAARAPGTVPRHK